MPRLKITGLASFGLVVLLGYSCAKNDFDSVQEHRVMMDTLVSISVFLPAGSAKAKATHDLQTVWRRMAVLDSALSNYRDDNEVFRINSQAAAAAIAVSPDILQMLRTAEQIEEISHGALDVTVEPLMRLWGFGRNPHLPRRTQIDSTLQYVGHQYLGIDTAYTTVRFKKAGVGIDLGAIAKGYIIDAGFLLLRQMGYTEVMVEAGGDLRVSAGPLTRKKRHIWITHPREQGRFFGRFQMDNGAVATSGDYERYFFQDEKRYHHILDPHTGYPATRSVSATVIAKDATTADGLATALFVLGPDAGIALAEQLPAVEALIIAEHDGKLQYKATAGLARIVEVLN